MGLFFEDFCSCFQYKSASLGNIISNKVQWVTFLVKDNILNQNFSFRLTLDEMYATLPKSLKEQNLITASLIEDPEVVAKNQEIVKSKTPAQLAQINNLDEFPIPNNIETLIKKRTLKSTSSKEASLNKR